MRTNNRSVVSIAWLVMFILTILYGLTGSAWAEADVNSPSWELKLDAEARLLISSFENPESERIVSLYDFISFYHDEDEDQWLVDVFIQLDDPANAPMLDALGVERRTIIEDIVVARLPVESLPLLAQQPYVRFVETSTIQKFSMDASRPEIQADQVHQGVNLPQSYEGNDIVVGVLDTGIDFTHADFSDSNGTRIQYLLEYTNGGGQIEWTKSQIDANPGGVIQRDADGNYGHGTHVAGTSVGGGKANPIYRGIAPKADIIFVKGTRTADSSGGFATTDITAACDYIFKKAQALDKPAVINLSLGGQQGPHDGTSLYEKSLSYLTGPGRIIVAAAGNDGWTTTYLAVHAGGPVVPNTTYGSLLIAAKDPTQTIVDMWYDQGVISDVNVVAYSVIQNQWIPQASTGWLPVGQRTPLPPPILRDSNGAVLGDVDIDARTTCDPNNDDGRILVWITNGPVSTVDIRNTYWLVIFRTQASGEVHMWPWLEKDAFGRGYSFSGVTSLPVNNSFTVGPPATAKKVISVGSYVTKNSWIDIDGTTQQWLIAPGTPPLIGQLSLFSSRGPTRDYRFVPGISAPGERIASALSSHLTQNVGYRRSNVVQGGSYQLMQGTSMAAPHVTGVVALMLEVYPYLDYDQAKQILQTTARTDSFTGSIPYLNFGAGKVDAYSAVQAVVTYTTSPVTFADPNLLVAVESALGVTAPTPIDMLNLNVLDVRNCGLKDLTGLETAVNLTILRLPDNQISNLQPLDGLTKLTQLFLYNNQISDLTPLEKMTNLTTLSLFNNQISDLTPLERLTELTQLWLHDNQINDLTPLAQMVKLYRLWLGSNQITDLSPLLTFQNLTDLNLLNNPLSTIALNQQIPQIIANNPNATVLY